MKLEAADLAAMDDGQRLAVLESLVVGIIADGKVTPGEIQRFDEVVLGLPWGVERPVLIAMVKGAHERLSVIKTPMQIQDFVASIAARLPSPEIRDKLVYTMGSLMRADGEIHQFEQNVLGLFVIAFGITSDRAAAIKAALTGKPAPAEAPSRPGAD